MGGGGGGFKTEWLTSDLVVCYTLVVVLAIVLCFGGAELNIRSD